MKTVTFGDPARTESEESCSFDVYLMSCRELKSLLKDMSETRERTRSMTVSQRAIRINAPLNGLGASPQGEIGEIESLRCQEESLKLQLDELQKKMEFDQVKLELEHLKSLDIQ